MVPIISHVAIRSKKQSINLTKKKARKGRSDSEKNSLDQLVSCGRVAGEPYLDRDASFDYKIEKGDLCYRLFAEHGFEWGGDWGDRKDYQHFEVPDEKIAEWYPENAE